MLPFPPKFRESESGAPCFLLQGEISSAVREGEEKGGLGGRAREEGWGRKGGGRGRNTGGVERSYINWSVRPTLPGPFWECDPGT